jgi:hypothetical protein
MGQTPLQPMLPIQRSAANGRFSAGLLILGFANANHTRMVFVIFWRDSNHGTVHMTR